MESGDRKRIVDPNKIAIPPSTEQIDARIQTPVVPKKAPITPRQQKEFVDKGIIIGSGSDKVIAYSCSRLAHLKEEIYVVQVKMAKTYSDALELVKSHTQKGFKTNAISLKCFYKNNTCLLYTSPSPRDATLSRMPSSA